MQSNWLPEIVNRSENGPFMKEGDYDMALALKCVQLVRAHGIIFERDALVPHDNDMADRLYQAGVELFLEMGVYNQSTERRILFTCEEVEAAVGAAPNTVTLGCGKDAVVERHRDVESLLPCRMHSGPTGTPCSEWLHPLILQACAQEPLVDCLGGGSVATYLGRLIVPGSPTEILASRKEAALARRAINQAGRPGMHIEDVAVPLTCAGKIATFDPALGLRPSDGLLVSQMPELKTNYDQLSRVAFMQSVGMHIVDLMTPLIGGLGGGAEGTAIVTVASHILGVLCYDVSYHFMGHMNLQWSHNTDRMGLWVQSIAGQALARNTPVVAVNDLYTRSGLGTPKFVGSGG
jgi:methylamine--corrinoid protein Co-methyltransferase